MTTKDLATLNRQCGQYMIEFKDNKINGYLITSFIDYQPNTIELQKTINRPNKVLSWDTAYDMLYGIPTAPDFTKAITL